MTDEELSAAVAERVMGWTKIRFAPEIGPVGYPPDSPIEFMVEFTDDIAAAFEVVEELRKRGFEPTLRAWKEYAVQIELPENAGRCPKFEHLEDNICVEAETMPRAICLAALAILNATKEIK